MVIDVIVPVFNGAKYVGRCIKSVVENKLSCPEDMIIKLTVINDGSTDKTVVVIQRVVEELALDDDFIKIIHQANSGVSLARNCGLDKTNGDFVIFLDADDWLPKNAIYNMVATAENNNADVVIGKSRYFFGKIPFTTTSETWHKMETGIVNPDKNNFLVEITPGIRAKLFRRKLFDTSRFPAKRIKWEDLALIPAIMAKADCIFYIDEVVYNYTVHMNTTIRDFCFRCNVLNVIDSLDILKTNLQQLGIYEDHLSEYHSILTLHTLFRVENAITWLNAGIKYKKFVANELISELEARYPDWKNDPVLKDPQRRYKDPFFNFLLKKSYL